jgi:HEAT repeat protein
MIYLRKNSADAETGYPIIASMVLTGAILCQINCTPAYAAGAPHSRATEHLRATQLSHLTKSLSEQSVDIRISSLNALAALGPKAAPAVPAIINALNENRNFAMSGSVAGRVSPRVTDAVIDALTKIGPGARDAAPYLLPLLTDRNELFRREQVLNALSSIGLDNSATKTVMRMVEEEGKLTQTRVAAIHLLGRISPPATEAVSLLQSLAKDESDKNSRKEALIALSSISQQAGKDSFETTGQGQKSDLDQVLEPSVEQEQRAEALRHISELGAKASYMVPKLIQLLNDKDLQIKQLAAEALASIGPEASAALPALIMQLALQKTDEDRQLYCRAISAIDAGGQKAIPLLQSTLNDPFKARGGIQVLEEFGTEQSLNLAQQMKTRWRLK